MLVCTLTVYSRNMQTPCTKGVDPRTRHLLNVSTIREGALLQPIQLGVEQSRWIKHKTTKLNIPNEHDTSVKFTVVCYIRLSQQIRHIPSKRQATADSARTDWHHLWRHRAGPFTHTCHAQQFWLWRCHKLHETESFARDSMHCVLDDNVVSHIAENNVNALIERWAKSQHTTPHVCRVFDCNSDSQVHWWAHNVTSHCNVNPV